MKTGETSTATLAYFRRAGSPIVACATAMGGPVAILRISGRDLSPLKHFLGPFPAPGQHALQTFRAKNTSTDEIIDKGLVLYFKAPHSFTGEDVIELQTHGVPAVIEKLINEIKKYGVESALPGEFSFRAVVNEKMTLAEAEALQASLSTEGLDQGWASKLLTLSPSAESEVNKRLESCIQSLEEARGRVEAAIDFSEATEEQAADVATSLERMNAAKSQLASLMAAFENFARAKSEIRIAIVGEPNVGKSTLFNRLAGGPKALVSPVPGTTRDVVEARFRFADGRWATVMDTAGVRQMNNVDAASHESIEQRGIELGLERAANADAIIWVQKSTDAKQIPPDIYKQVFTGKTLIKIFSFADTNQAVMNFFDLRDLSAKNDDRLRAQIEEGAKLLSGQGSTNNDQVVSRRQYEHMQRASDALLRAAECLKGESPLELAGDNLREAETEIKFALGRDLGEGYIEAIFRQFCLGK